MANIFITKKLEAYFIQSLILTKFLNVLRFVLSDCLPVIFLVLNKIEERGPVKVWMQKEEFKVEYFSLKSKKLPEL